MFGKVPTALMFVDRNRNGQRAVSDTNIAKMGAWDASKSRALVVNILNNGMVSVCDGQHRMTVAKKHGVETLMCEIWQGLTPGEEAQKFADLNNSKPLNGNDKYFNLLKHDGDNAAKRIEAILRRHGFRTPHPDRKDDDLTFTCCGTLLDIASGRGKRKNVTGRGCDIIATTIDVVNQCYRVGNKGIQPTAKNGDFLAGLARFLKDKNATEVAATTRALKKHGSASALKGIADARNSANGKRDGRKASVFMAEVIEETVNRGGVQPSR